ncbi:MAG: PKD domain-containing protein [Bacteroidales bacterium]|nr:PKD domain-containing protein [Bacteroidales bacterium]MCF8455145.1 PKD domain-containing protein [Bacteroidales bacterium]
MKRNFLSPLISAMLIGSILVIFGCSKEEKENIPPTLVITNPLPDATFSGNTLVTITTDAQDADGNIAQVMFYVDNIYVSSVNNPPYNYVWNTSGESMGDHIIKAKAADNYGGLAFASITLRVITGPTAKFVADKTNIFQGETVVFTDQSTNSPATWAWDFGDGSNSTDQNPAHTYNDPGNYTVSLTVGNTEGSNTETKTDYITVLTNTITDVRDAQEYKIVEIGTQIWMAENLNFDAGTGECWQYENSAANGDVYGRLYTWTAAMTACPAGWHLSSDDDWDVLLTFLGGDLVAGGKLKETGTSHWTAPNDFATNESGFTALPGGYMDWVNGFKNLGGTAYFWTSKDIAGFYSATSKKIFNDAAGVQSADVEHGNGLAVRCVKD